MNDFSIRQSEIINQLLILLPTIEEALQHMEKQLTELRLEESAVLFQNTATAIGSIAYSILPVLQQDKEQRLFTTFAELRQAVSLMVDAYEQGELSILQSILANQLIPAYHCWHKELSLVVAPSMLS